MRVSKPQGGFIILEESDPEEILKESIALSKRSSEIVLGKRITLSFWKRLGLYMRIMAMKYLRILKKADFEELLERDPKFHELRTVSQSLQREEAESKRKLDTAGTDVKEYTNLSRKLVNFDKELEKVHSKYVEVRDKRAAFVKDLNTQQKAVYDEAKDDIQYYAKKLQKTQREIRNVQKAISNYRVARYKELSVGRIKEAGEGRDHPRPE
jgi:myosin heavy subunit